jgi:hypothetical protein
MSEQEAYRNENPYVERTGKEKIKPVDNSDHHVSTGIGD